MTLDTHTRLASIAGTRAPEDLPNSCRCGARWSGSNTAHCGACHRYTFTGIGAFDAHRKGRHCNPPGDVGLVLIPGRAYEVWGTRSVEGEAA